MAHDHVEAPFWLYQEKTWMLKFTQKKLLPRSKIKQQTTTAGKECEVHMWGLDSKHSCWI